MQILEGSTFVPSCFSRDFGPVIPSFFDNFGWSLECLLDLVQLRLCDPALRHYRVQELHGHCRDILQITEIGRIVSIVEADGRAVAIHGETQVEPDATRMSDTAGLVLPWYSLIIACHK